jgi:hypothetical protein
MTWRRAKTYSDECGGALTAAYREDDDARCTDGKRALKIRVLRDRRVVWSPRDVMCVREPSSRAKIVEDIVGFFEHASCGAKSREIRSIVQDAAIEAKAARAGGDRKRARKLTEQARQLQREAAALDGRKRKSLSAAKTSSGFPVRFPSVRRGQR